MPPWAPASLAGGRYQVQEVLGDGGMAVVLRVSDRQGGPDRAAKLLFPAMARRRAVRGRFEREARALMALRHPHIVRVLEVGAEGETPWLVMELVRGGTLAELVNRSGPLPGDRACQVALEVLSALEHAHLTGVIHRDVKPPNVMLDEHGRAVLTDFGLARVDDGVDAATRTGVAMGTPAYMAPEQRVSAKDADHRADLYAVGATLFAICTGEDPFDLSRLTLSEAMLRGVPEPLHDVIRRATRPAPDDRYGSAAEMAAAVAAARARLGPVDPGASVYDERPARPPGRLLGTLVPDAPASEMGVTHLLEEDEADEAGVTHLLEEDEEDGPTEVGVTHLLEEEPAAVAPTPAPRPTVPVGWVLGGVAVVIVLMGMACAVGAGGAVLLLR